MVHTKRGWNIIPEKQMDCATLIWNKNKYTETKKRGETNTGGEGKGCSLKRWVQETSANYLKMELKL